MTSDDAERFLDKLEASWSQGDIPSLSERLSSLSQSLFEIVAVEACAIDLQARWRLAAASSDDAVIKDAQDYQSLLGVLWDSVASKKELLEAEWFARNHWSMSQDLPDVFRFAEQLPEVSDWPIQLAKTLHSLSRLSVHTTNSDGLVQTLVMPSDFTIGRQANQEPPPTKWLPEKRKLVIAADHERTISRSQVSVFRSAKYGVQLTNTSSLVTLRFPNGSLAAGESKTFAIPVQFSMCNHDFVIGQDT